MKEKTKLARQDKALRLRADLQVEVGPSGINCWHDKIGTIFFSDIISEQAAFHFKASKRHWYTQEELRWIADRMDRCEIRGIEAISGCPQGDGK